MKITNAIKIRFKALDSWAKQKEKELESEGDFALPKLEEQHKQAALIFIILAFTSVVGMLIITLIIFSGFITDMEEVNSSWWKRSRRKDFEFDLLSWISLLMVNVAIAAIMFT